MPPPYRLTSSQAIEAVGTCARRLRLIGLPVESVPHLLERGAELNVQGGTIYDFMKAEAEVIYTWNLRHYRLFGEDIRARLQTPEQRRY